MLPVHSAKRETFLAFLILGLAAFSGACSLPAEGVETVGPAAATAPVRMPVGVAEVTREDVA